MGKKILITNKFIESLYPCERGYRNYMKHCEGKEYELADFLKLDVIPYEDRVWLIKKIFTKDQLVKWSIKCAMSVYHIYKKYNENDIAVIDLLNFLSSIKDFTNLTSENILIIREKRRAAYAAAGDAYAAAGAAGAYAAYFAAYAAAYAAVDAVDAVDAAAYSANSYAYSANAYSVYAAGDAYAADVQREKNLELAIKVILN